MATKLWKQLNTKYQQEMLVACHVCGREFQKKNEKKHQQTQRHINKGKLLAWIERIDANLGSCSDEELWGMTLVH